LAYRFIRRHELGRGSHLLRGSRQPVGGHRVCLDQVVLVRS
jgi:hypothetical protein